MSEPVFIVTQPPLLFDWDAMFSSVPASGFALERTVTFPWWTGEEYSVVPPLVPIQYSTPSLPNSVSHVVSRS